MKPVDAVEYHKIKALTEGKMKKTTTLKWRLLVKGL